MTKWEEKIAKYEVERYIGFANIIRAAKEYIDANHNVRSHPCGWKNVRGPKEDPRWQEYYALAEVYSKASSKLWMATDCEYGDHEIANAAWTWRYWKVMARKCCYYQKRPWTDHLASRTMKKLGNAELHLMRVCGLEDLYKSPCHYIEEAFPGLKSSK